MTMNLNTNLARKILSVVDAGLVSGVGKPVPGQMCVEAAVCYALGQPHGDDPDCVAAPDRSFKIRLNDSRWSSPAARARGLRRLSVQQLGTKGLDRSEWLRILVELTIRRVLPEAAEAAAKLGPACADALRAAGKRCADEGTRKAALVLKSAAADYAAAAADYAVYAAYAATNATNAVNAADSAATDSAATADADANAAYGAANAANGAANTAYGAAYAAYAAAYADAERDRILTISARCAEEAYERTGSPGVELLRQIESDAT